MNRRLIFCVLLPLVCFAFDVTGATSAAQSNDGDEKQSIPTIGGRAWAGLGRIQNRIDKAQYKRALTEVNKFLKNKKLNANERSHGLNQRAYILLQQEKRAASIAAYEAVLEQRPGVTQSLEVQTLETLAKLELQAGRPKRSLAYMDELVEGVEQPSAAHFELIAQTHYTVRDFPAALHALEKRKEVASAQEVLENEAMLKLEVYMLREEKRWDPYIVAMEMLYREYPERHHLLSIADAYKQLGNTRRSEQTYTRLERKMGEVLEVFESSMARGTAAYERGNFETAASVFAEAVAVNGFLDRNRNFASSHALARCWIQLGNYDESIRWYSSAVLEKVSEETVVSELVDELGLEAAVVVEIARDLHELGRGLFADKRHADARFVLTHSLRFFEATEGQATLEWVRAHDLLKRVEG